MTTDTALFKIGGSILGNQENINNTISQLKYLHSEALFRKIIIITGGGSYANFIRELYSHLELSEELAHWMGILSMNYNGKELKSKFPEIHVTKSLDHIKELDEGFFIFLPFQYLKECDSLPHNWDVTSDSICLFLANELNLKECFLIKDVEGILDKNGKIIKEISTSEFKELKTLSKLVLMHSQDIDLKEQSKPIDSYLLTLIEKYQLPCILLNGGGNQKRILDYFTSSDLGERIYTKISF